MKQETYVLVNQYGAVLEEGSFDKCEDMMWHLVSEEAHIATAEGLFETIEEAEMYYGLNYAIVEKEDTDV